MSASPAIPQDLSGSFRIFQDLSGSFRIFQDLSGSFQSKMKREKPKIYPSFWSFQRFFLCSSSWNSSKLLGNGSQGEGARGGEWIDLDSLYQTLHRSFSINSPPPSKCSLLINKCININLPVLIIFDEYANETGSWRIPHDSSSWRCGLIQSKRLRGRKSNKKEDTTTRYRINFYAFTRLFISIALASSFSFSVNGDLTQSADIIAHRLISSIHLHIICISTAQVKYRFQRKWRRRSANRLEWFLLVFPRVYNSSVGRGDTLVHFSFFALFFSSSSVANPTGKITLINSSSSSSSGLLGLRKCGFSVKVLDLPRSSFDETRKRPAQPIDNAIIYLSAREKPRLITFAGFSNPRVQSIELPAGKLASFPRKRRKR